MVKLLRVSLVAVVMALFCVIPALALEYPSDLPAPPDDALDYHYVVVQSGNSVRLVFVDDPTYISFDSTSSILNVTTSSGGSFGIYDIYASSGTWGLSFPYGSLTTQYSLSNVTLIYYSTFDVYDTSGNLYFVGSGTGPSVEPLDPPWVNPPGYPDILPDLPNLYEYVLEEGSDPYDCCIYVFRNVETGVYMYRFIADPSQFYYDADSLRFNAFSPGLYYYGGCEFWEAGEDYDAGYDFYPSFATYRLTEWGLDIVRNGELIYASGPVYASDGSLLYEDGFVHPDLVPVPPYEGPAPVPEKNLAPSHSYDSPSYLADPDSEIDFETPGDPSDAEDPFTQLNLMVGSIFGILTQIYNLYAGTWLLTGFLMLWLIRKVAKLFNKL